MKKVVIPIPETDFDPTEAGVSWKVLRENGIGVVFATSNAKVATGDQRMLSGKGLGPLASLLKADHNGLKSYSEMLESAEFRCPIRWDQIHANDFAGLVLPGGHAPGMKVYLESKILHQVTADFFKSSKIIGVICHGIVLAARSKSSDGTSVLAGRRVTALLRSQELAAWLLTCLWLGGYYRTYSETVQTEVKRNLGSRGVFVTGSIPLKRDTPENMDSGFVVEDGNLISARWPGDVHLFAKTLVKRLLS